MAKETGVMPLDYLLAVMRDEEQAQEVRIDAAKAVLPYLHPRLAAVEHFGPNEGMVEIVSKQQRDAAVAAALRADA